MQEREVKEWEVSPAVMEEVHLKETQHKLKSESEVRILQAALHDATCREQTLEGRRLPGHALRILSF